MIRKEQKGSNVKISVLTLFPEIFDGFLDAGLIGRARRTGLLDVELVNIRDFASDKHRTVDDTPYGGGCGMIMKPEPLSRAVRRTQKARGEAHRIFLTPQGSPLNVKKIVELAGKDHLLLVCGRYEGVDERFRESFVDEEISLGDFVLSGGEVAAMAMIEGVGRLLPGVMGNKGSAAEESFSEPLLEYPQYTRPAVFEGRDVPSVLLEGNHAEIRKWRRMKSEERTKLRRLDIYSEFCERTKTEPEGPVNSLKTGVKGIQKNLLTNDASRTYVALLHHPVLDRNGQLVTTALTNLDLHDIARASKTFGLGGYYVVTPIQKQRELARRIVGHWVDGKGCLANSRRRKALDLVKVKADLGGLFESVKDDHGVEPVFIGTTANPGHRPVVSCSELFNRPELVKRPVVLLFGTGWGLTDEMINRADLLLEPILGPGNYNHLSVRSAVSIYLGRLFSRKQ